jgi:signal transduction histidine kinase
MRSLTSKLALAFLLVGLTGAVLVAIIIQYRTRTAFDQFILNREQQTLVASLEAYYQINQTWNGIENELPAILYTLSRPFDGKDFHRNWGRFTLVAADHIVVFSVLPNQIGRLAPDDELEQAIVLKADSETIGWLLLAPIPREWIPDSPEDRFLQNVTSATLLSALVATLLALTLGGLLAFTITRSLRELTDATVAIAKGQLGKQVKVRSKDEIGKLAASFNQMSLDLERATRARRQMTADIAHDLRSPLSVIAGYAEALSDGKLPGAPDVYAILYQETKHLNRLVDDLRTLSLADAGELQLILQPVEPRLLLDRVTARHAVTAQQKNIAFRVEAEPELPLVTVDVERMAQVFDNLILNAFRYIPQGGEIRLAAKSANGAVQLQIQDNGRGIDPQDLPHIFDRFYRGDKSRQQNGESGLGLAIARSIVEAHGGTITAYSPPGQGATFIITLESR